MKSKPNFQAGIEHATRRMLSRPMGTQRAVRTWTRDEVVLRGLDLEAEAKRSRKAAKKMEYGRKYTNTEVWELMGR